MGWFGPSNCAYGCCTDVCTDCTNITYVTISGLTNANCPEGCDAKNGTYVFRTLSDPIPLNCLWVVKRWPNNNCGADDSPTLYVGGVYSGCNYVELSLQLINVEGGVKVRINASFSYETSPDGGFTVYIATYHVKWEKTFATCASISGTIPHFSTVTTICDIGSSGDSGDLCGLASATVSIG